MWGYNMTDQKFFRYSLLLLAAFLATRYIYFKQIWDTPILNFLVLDSEYYFGWARALAAGHSSPPGPYWLSPLYSHVLAGLFAATGSSTIGLSLVFNGLLSAGTFTFLLLTARKLWGDVTALVTGGLCVLYAPWLYYDGMLLTASLILCLNAALLYVLARIFDQTNDGMESASTEKVPRYFDQKLWAIAGIITGLSALARPSIMIFALLLIAWMWRTVGVGRMRVIGIYLGAIFIAVSPVLIRNLIASGSPTLTTAAGGINFYIGNRTGASGIYDDLPWVESSDPEREAEAYRREASNRSDDSLSLAQANRYWGLRALSDIANRPLNWLILLGKKTLLTIQNAEFANNLSIRAVSWFSPIVKALPLRWGILFPLAAVTWILFWRGRVATYLWLYVATYVFTGVIFFTASEYRLPLILLMLPAAAHFFATLWSLVAAKNMRTILKACALYVVLLVIVNFPSGFALERTKPGMDFQNLGTIAQDRKLFADAIPLYARALTVDESLVDARLGLAECLWRMGSYDDARAQFALAGVAPPDSLQGAPLIKLISTVDSIKSVSGAESALAYLSTQFTNPLETPLDALLLKASLEEKLKDYSRALQSYRLAILHDRENPELLHRAGLMAAWIDRDVLSDSLYRAAIKLYPAYAPSRIELGLLSLYRGDTETAREQVGELQKIRIPDDSLRARSDTLTAMVARIDQASQ